MNNIQALDQFRDFGNAVRPALVLTAGIFIGTMIGKKNDAPVEGLAAGIAVSAIINGVWNWQDARKQTENNDEG